MIRWKKGQNIVTAQTVSEHFAVSYISVTIFTRLRLTLYRELNIINFNYDDIYKDDLVEKVKKADKEAKEYYAKLDKEKLEQEKEVDEK